MEYGIFEKVNIPELNKDYYLYNLSYSNQVLELIYRFLKEDEKEVIVKFPGVMSYRLSLEGALLKTINENPTLRGLCKFKESAFLTAFHVESLDVFHDFGLVHFFFPDITSVVEIIAGDRFEVNVTDVR